MKTAAIEKTLIELGNNAIGTMVSVSEQYGGSAGKLAKVIGFRLGENPAVDVKIDGYRKCDIPMSEITIKVSFNELSKESQAIALLDIMLRNKSISSHNKITIDNALFFVDGAYAEHTADIRNHFDKQYDLIPEDYEIIGWGYPEPACDEMGRMYTIAALDYNGFCRDGDVSEEQDEWLRSVVGTSSTCCNHCGKRMKYFAIIAHLESRELHIIGTQCASSMRHYSQDVVDGMHKSTLKARQRANRVQKERKARANAEAFIDGVAGLRDALKTDHYIINDIGFKLMQYGSISEKQIELIFKIQQQVEERKREQAAREAAGAARKHFGKVGERIRSHSIKCVFSKSFDGDFGTWHLVKFEDADGNQFVYRGSAWYERNEEYVASFTIKDHSEFRGEKQTIVSRIHLHECV